MKILPLFLAFSLGWFAFLAKPFVPRDRAVTRTIGSIVKITGTKDGQSASCTGMVLDKKHILTANHCALEDMRQDGIPMEIEQSDAYLDLALGSTKFLTKPPVTFRDRPVEKYEELTGIGYGYGWDQALVLEQLVIFPSLSPDITWLPPGIVVQGGYIGGMSGGPVIDKDGKVVGIIQISKDNVGYGVDVATIKEFLAETK